MTDKFRKYMMGIQHLISKDHHELSAILATVNHERVQNGQKRIVHFNDLPEHMLDQSFFDLFIATAKDYMGDSPDKLNEFLKIIDIPVSTSMIKVKNYMEKIPQNTTLKSKNTLEEVIHMFANMPTAGRYILVMEGSNLIGLISVSDFNSNFESIKNMDKKTALSNLPFLTKEVKSINEDASMADARKFMRQLKDAGMRITKLLVVDKNKKPVGFLDDGDLSKWEASSLES